MIKLSMNYTNLLPDFLAMQRVSFCWFISQGLTEELAFFSQIYNFSKTTEYFLFSNEYRLIKPLYNLSLARKYSGNYKVQLVIPIEIRNKKINSTRYQNQFLITTLPLMTTYATFIINGCERLIVSQIIRSPGVYFEKIKKQQPKKKFKRKHSTDINKLRSFLPSGDFFLIDNDFFFSTPNLISDKIIDTNKKKVFPNWDKFSIQYYSVQYLKKTFSSSTYYFFKCFKFYNLFLQIDKSIKKKKLILVFIKWINLKIKILNLKGYLLDLKTTNTFFTYFQFLAILILKYKILQKLSSQGKKLYLPSIKKSLKKLTIYEFSKLQDIKIVKTYKNILKNAQFFSYLKFNASFFLLSKTSYNWLFIINNFLFFKKNLNIQPKKIYQVKQFYKFKNCKPTIYFSISLKEQLKYLFGKTQFLKRAKLHRYLKNKTQLLLYQKDHEIKTKYHQKYDIKELYKATLIPEQGSWVHFGFKKNIDINIYKYPIKNQEDEIIVQFDKKQQIPILLLLKEMGLTDNEIKKSLTFSDFFYFENPLLLKSNSILKPVSRFNLDLKLQTPQTFSTFLKIFNPNYYKLGKTGRLKCNNRLNLAFNNNLQIITYEDILGIIDNLISLSISKGITDDIDHLQNRRVRSVGELLQNVLRLGFQRLVRKSQNQTEKFDSNYLLNFNIINSGIKEFFNSSQLSQYLDQTNPLASLTHRRRISGLGPGGFNRDRISFSVRDIHPSHYGRICPIETSEGQNVGLISSLTTSARVNSIGFLETPFWRVINGKVIKTKTPIYLTADIEDLYKIAPSDLVINKENYILKNMIPVRYKQDFINVAPSEVDFIGISTIQVVSIAASLIPFFEHDDANRALMGSNMQRQSVPLMFPQKPIVGTGLEHQIAIDSGMAVSAQTSGTVSSVTANKIVVKTINGQKVTYKLQKYLRSNQQTCITQRPIVWKGQNILSGQILTDGPAITNTELSLGQNILVAYMPWQGYNFEDAILISERLVYDDILTSIHIERYRIEINRHSEHPEEPMKMIPDLSLAEINHLNEDGIVKVGTFVKPGDILVGKVISNKNSKQLPEFKLLRAIFGTKTKGIKDNSYRMPNRNYGRVIETVSFNRKSQFIYKFEWVYVFIAQIRKIQIGDKIAGRHGNKGIISRILPRQDMPFLPDGTPIDIILNPLGVPSRMNVGQLYECLLGLAGEKLNSRFKILPFDEMYTLEASRILINKKLRKASIKKNESWLFNPYAPGKVVLMDGRTGTEFENPITVGKAYMLKLIHLVDDKMHARATGPYSLITQQPLRGKAQYGGQRFGEMEVWALEGFGAAFTLKELLTIKSDDIDGRNKTLSVILKGQSVPQFGIPESFKVLLQELRSIGLDMSVHQLNKFSSLNYGENEINLMEKYSSKNFFPTLNTTDISFE